MLTLPGGISRTYPGTFPPASGALVLEFPNLPASDSPLTITVQAFDGSGCVVGSGTKSVTIAAGAKTTSNVTLAKSTGCGDGGILGGFKDGGEAGSPGEAGAPDGAGTAVDSADALVVIDVVDATAVDASKDTPPSVSAEAGAGPDTPAAPVDATSADGRDAPAISDAATDSPIAIGGASGSGGAGGGGATSSGGVVGSGGTSSGGVTGAGGFEQRRRNRIRRHGRRRLDRFRRCHRLGRSRNRRRDRNRRDVRLWWRASLRWCGNRGSHQLRRRHQLRRFRQRRRAIFGRFRRWRKLRRRYSQRRRRQLCSHLFLFLRLPQRRYRELRGECGLPDRLSYGRNGNMRTYGGRDLDTTGSVPILVLGSVVLRRHEVSGDSKHRLYFYISGFWRDMATAGHVAALVVSSVFRRWSETGGGRRQPDLHVVRLRSDMDADDFPSAKLDPFGCIFGRRNETGSRFPRRLHLHVGRFRGTLVAEWNSAKLECCRIFSRREIPDCCELRSERASKLEWLHLRIVGLRGDLDPTVRKSELADGCDVQRRN